MLTLSCYLNVNSSFVIHWQHVQNLMFPMDLLKFAKTTTCCPTPAIPVTSFTPMAGGVKPNVLAASGLDLNQLNASVIILYWLTGEAEIHLRFWNQWIIPEVIKQLVLKGRSIPLYIGVNASHLFLIPNKIGYGRSNSIFHYRLHEWIMWWLEFVKTWAEVRSLFSNFVN